MSIRGKRIILTGGGTAGHVFPILSVAKILKEHWGCQLLYLGTPFGIEKRLVKGKLDYGWILSGKLRRYFSLATLWDLVKLGLGVALAYFRVKQFKPDLIFAKGGYVSLPVLVAGRALHIPIVNHESDVVLGVTNRLAHKWAKRSCFGFALNYYSRINKKKAVFTGTPGQPDFLKNFRQARVKDWGFNDNQPTLLILGGSQGARSLNFLFQPILARLLQKMQIIHMTGSRDIKEFEKIKAELSPEFRAKYRAISFLDEKKLAAGYKAADLVVSRAGASTLVDIALAQKPAILVPLPWASGNHQLANAKIFSRMDAALRLDQAKLTSQQLFREIEHLLNDKTDLRLMAKRVSRLAEPCASQKIIKVIGDTLSR